MTDAEIRWLEFELDLKDMAANLDAQVAKIEALASAPPPPWYRVEWEDFVWSWRNRRWQTATALLGMTLSVVALVLSLLS